MMRMLLTGKKKRKKKHKLNVVKLSELKAGLNNLLIQTLYKTA